MKPLDPLDCEDCMGGLGRGARGGVFVYTALVLLLRAGVDGLDIVEPPLCGGVPGKEIEDVT